MHDDAASGVDGFDRFFSEQLASVTAVALALTGSAALAEEIAQEAFLAAFRRWDRVRSLDEPGAWVRRVAANVATSGFRRRLAEVRALTRLGLPRSVAPPLEAGDSELWQAVRSLPRRQAQVVALRYADDLSVGEIAAVLGCAEATVRVHLHRGRQALARDLGAPVPDDESEDGR